MAVKGGRVRLLAKPNRIKELRIRRGLSQGDVAELIGISRQHYSMVEAGSASPSPRAAKKVADFYSVEIDDLFNTLLIRAS